MAAPTLILYHHLGLVLPSVGQYDTTFPTYFIGRYGFTFAGIEYYIEPTSIMVWLPVLGVVRDHVYSML
jgi:hypothetical protein